MILLLNLLFAVLGFFLGTWVALRLALDERIGFFLGIITAILVFIADFATRVK